MTVTDLKPKAGEVSMWATGEIINLSNALAEARDALSAWKTREAALKAELFDALVAAEADSATVGGKVIARRTTVKPAPRFNTDAFKADHPDLASQYVMDVEPYTKVQAVYYKAEA